MYLFPFLLVKVLIPFSCLTAYVYSYVSYAFTGLPW